MPHDTDLNQLVRLIEQDARACPTLTRREVCERYELTPLGLDALLQLAEGLDTSDDHYILCAA